MTARGEPGSVRGLLRVEYDTLVLAGLLEDEPVELLQGAMVVTRPPDPGEANAIQRLTTLLFRRLSDDWDVAVRAPLAVSDDSEPEPDLAVIANADHSREHPKTAALVVEVARTSQRTDLGPQGRPLCRRGRPRLLGRRPRCPTGALQRDPGPDGYAAVVQLSEGALRTTGPLDLSVDVSTVLR